MIYELKAENLSRVGLRMGMETTTVDSIGLFDTVDAAKAKAERLYGKPIAWDRPDSNGRVYSPDLRWVMYSIIPRYVGS